MQHNGGALRALVPVLAGVLLGGQLLAGCAPRVCHEPEIPAFPVLLLTVSAWTDIHPQATVRGCADGTCQSVTASSVDRPLFIEYRAADPTADVTVSVTSTEDGLTVLDVSQRFRPVLFSEPGPCGDISYWQTPVTLAGDGGLRAG